MRRCAAILASLVCLAFALLTPSAVTAATPVTGTIDCEATGAMRFGPPFLPGELAEPNTRPLRTKVASETSSCDDAGVVGGQIGSVKVSVQGKVAAETSCLDFLDTVSFPAKVRLRWRGSHNIGTSKTTVASVTYDGADAFVLVTNPIVKGPFTGQTATMRFGFPTNAAAYADACSNSDLRFTAFLFQPAAGTWTISVP